MRVFTVVSVFAASISAAAIEGYRNSYNGTLDNHNPSHLRPPPSVQGRSPPTNDTHKGIIPSHERPPLSSRDDLPPTDRPHKVFIPSHLRPPLSDKNLSPNYTLEELFNQTGLTFLPFGTEDDPHTRVFDEESGARQRRGMKQKRGDITVRHDPVCNRLAAPNKIGDGWKGALQLAELLDRWEPGNEWQDSFSIWIGTQSRDKEYGAEIKQIIRKVHDFLTGNVEKSFELRVHCETEKKEQSACSQFSTFSNIESDNPFTPSITLCPPFWEAPTLEAQMQLIGTAGVHMACYNPSVMELWLGTSAQIIFHSVLNLVLQMHLSQQPEQYQTPFDAWWVAQQKNAKVSRYNPSSYTFTALAIINKVNGGLAPLQPAKLAGPMPWFESKMESDKCDSLKPPKDPNPEPKPFQRSHWLDMRIWGDNPLPKSFWAADHWPQDGAICKFAETVECATYPGFDGVRPFPGMWWESPFSEGSEVRMGRWRPNDHGVWAWQREFDVGDKFGEPPVRGEYGG